MRTDLVLDALRMALARREPGADVELDPSQRRTAAQGGFNWSSQHLDGGGVAMGTMRERQREVQLYRGQVPSPGRPTVAWREDRVRFWAGDRSWAEDRGRGAARRACPRRWRSGGSATLAA